jgi:hypothetical protein
MGSVPLSALRPIEEHPDSDVVGEFLEPVHHTSPNKENVSRFEAMAIVAIPEPAAPPHYGVHLVPSMGRLRVIAPWGVELDRQAAVPEQLDEPLTV